MMEKAGELLKAFLRRQDLPEAEPCLSLARGWKGLVEASLRDHSCPVDVRNGMLVVEVDHPGWMQRLQMQQERLLGQVRRRYSQLGIRGISIRVNLKLASGGSAEPVAGGAAQPPAAMEIREALEGVKEDELRGLLARLYARVAERNRARPQS